MIGAGLKVSRTDGGRIVCAAKARHVRDRTACNGAALHLAANPEPCGTAYLLGRGAVRCGFTVMRRSWVMNCGSVVSQGRGYNSPVSLRRQGRCAQSRDGCKGTQHRSESYGPAHGERCGQSRDSPV
jgi:hypothetical protein